MSFGLPHVDEYVAQLPDGLASYPEAVAKASTLRQMRSILPADFEWDRMPAELREVVVSPPPVSSWVPESIACAVSLAVRDIAFDDDAAFLDWIEGGFSTFFAGPLYRVLMAVASPHSLARGAGKRWAALRKGTTRSLVEEHPNGNISRVDYPPWLVPRLHAEGTARGILVAYRLSRARDPRVLIEEHSSVHYVTRVIYDAGRGDIDG